MASKFPEKYKNKLETLKRAIIIRSPLRSDLAYFDYNSSEDKFYNLYLLVTITDVDCQNCFFEPKEIGDVLDDFETELMKSARLKVGSQLSIGGGNSLRGIGTNEVHFVDGEFKKIVFELVYDTELNWLRFKSFYDIIDNSFNRNT